MGLRVDTTVKLFTRMLCNLNVCVYVIFIRCDRRTSDNKHKKQSQNLVGNNQSYQQLLYSTKQQNQKPISLDKAI